MSEKSIEKIDALKHALIDYLGTDGRHYSDLSRMEQSVEDLIQALYTRLDQLARAHGGASPSAVGSETPRQRLADRMLRSAQELIQGGNVDEETADQFVRTLDMFDVAADLRRKSESIRDAGETAAILHKRNGR